MILTFSFTGYTAMHAMPRVHGCVAPPAKDTEREARPGADTTVGPGSRSRLLLEPLPCDSAPGPGNTRGRDHRQSKTDCTVSRTFGLHSTASLGGSAGRQNTNTAGVEESGTHKRSHTHYIRFYPR